MDLLQGLVRIAKTPQSPSNTVPGAHPRVMPGVEKGLGAVVLGIVEGPGLLYVSLGRGELSKIEQDRPQRMPGLQEERGVLGTLGQAEELFPQLTGPRVLRPPKMKRKQSHEHREELRRLPHLLTELPRPGVDSLYFWNRKAFGVHQGRAQDNLQGELLLDTLGGIRQGLEQLQGSGQVTNGLRIGRALRGLLPCQVEVLYGFLRITTARVVIRQLAVVMVVQGGAVEGFYCLCRALMDGFAPFY